MIIEHTRIVRVQGDIIAVPASGVSYGELATVKSRSGVSLAQVIRLQGDDVFLQVFAGHAASPPATPSDSLDTPCKWRLATRCWAGYSTVPGTP